MVCVVGRMRDLILQLSKSSIYSTKPRTVRYDWLGHYLFYSLSELQEYATQWQWFYNHERPNMALNGFTPMQHIQRLSDSTYLPG